MLGRCMPSKRSILKTTNHILVIAVVVCLLSCQTDDCEHIMLPDQFLEGESQQYQSWNDVQTFVYVDSFGTEIRFDLSTCVDTEEPNIFMDMCSDTVRNVIYNSERHLKRYTSLDKVSVVYVHRVDFIEGEQSIVEEKLVDKLVLSIFNDSIPTGIPVGRIRIMTSPKQSNYSQPDYNSTFSIYYDSIVIFDRTYYEVLEERSDHPKIYYNTAQGVVAFADHTGRRYVLDHTE